MNRVVTYSLLAYINNESKNIHDLADIFIPLIKRAIYKLDEQGVTKGKIEDIKEITDKIYNLDIPYTILYILIQKIADDQNTKESGSFKYYSDRAFKIKEFIFADCEDIINRQELENCFRVRNCIAHQNGFIQKLRYPDKIIKYATKKGILVDKNDQPELLLNQIFNTEVCDTMSKFYEKLMSTYYSTPLPE